MLRTCPVSAEVVPDPEMAGVNPSAIRRRYDQRMARPTNTFDMI